MPDNVAALLNDRACWWSEGRRFLGRLRSSAGLPDRADPCDRLVAYEHSYAAEPLGNVSDRAAARSEPHLGRATAGRRTRPRSACRDAESRPTLRVIAAHDQHHYLPQFLQRRFGCTPGDPKTKITRLELASGDTRVSSPRNEAKRRHFYRAVLEDGTFDHQAEELFGAIESSAASAIGRLVAARCLLPSPEDIVNLAKFIATMLHRTPDGRADLAAMDVEMSRLAAEALFSDPECVRRGLPPGATDEGVEAWRARLLRDLAAGDIVFSSTPTREIGLVFGAFAPTVEWLFSAARWTLLRAPPESELILADTPIAQYDPGRQFEEAGAGFNSSPRAMTLVPIDRYAALLIQPSPDGLFDWRARRIGPHLVDHVNALFYAQADDAIVGSSRQRLQAVADSARANPERQHEYRRRRARIWVSRVGPDDHPSGTEERRPFHSTNRDGAVTRTLRVRSSDAPEVSDDRVERPQREP